MLVETRQVRMEHTTSIQVIVAGTPGLNLHGTGCPGWKVLVSNTRASAGFVQTPEQTTPQHTNNDDMRRKTREMKRDKMRSTILEMKKRLRCRSWRRC